MEIIYRKGFVNWITPQDVISAVKSYTKDEQMLHKIGFKSSFKFQGAKEARQFETPSRWFKKIITAKS